MPRMSAAELHHFMAEQFPQASHLAMRVEHVDEKSIRVRLPTDDRHLRPGGTVSGPTLMWLCDASMYMLILAQIGPVALAVTTSLTINFLRKPEPGDILAEGRLLKLGQRLAVGDFLLYSEGVDDPVAQCSLTYSIPPRGK